MKVSKKNIKQNFPTQTSIQKKELKLDASQSAEFLSSTKLNIAPAYDALEKQVNIIADKVINEQQAEPIDFSQDNIIQRKHSEENNKTFEEFANNTPAKPLDGNTRSSMESRFNYDFSDVKIHDDHSSAEKADSINALAFTSGNNIFFNEGQYDTSSDSGKKLLAHELTHVVQQNTSNTDASLIQRQPKDTPYDKALVERAKKRLAFLKPKLDYLRSIKTAIDIDKTRAMGERQQLDAKSMQVDWKERAAKEEDNFSKLNRQPIDIILTDDAVLFKVKFQCFFNNPKAQNFGVLKRSVADGINLVWNQTLASGIFKGRKFSIVPEVELINSLQDRTSDHWLIEVRSSDTAPVNHPGCSLPQPSPGIPTSVTDPLCDNGVMNIPPLHTSMPGIIGHEMLHLFGLFDRYISVNQIKGGKVVGFVLVPTRETGNRKDPLGGEDATILIEDLNYLFLKLGVYDKEEARSGSMLSLVEREVMRLEKIIQLGYDPDSLIKVREDFRDKIMDSANDLD